jgi:hypothetical protein
MMAVTRRHFTMQPAPCGKFEQELLPAKSGGGRACFQALLRRVGLISNQQDRH